MSSFRPFSVTLVISTMGTWCLQLFQVTISLSGRLCVNCNDGHPNDWLIWLLLLVFFMAFVCGVLLFCLHHWLNSHQTDPSRSAMAVFAVGDLGTNCGTEAAVNPTVGFHFQTQNPEHHPVSHFGTLSPSPS
ncbi:Transmembrane protein 207 [Heterocephalus glaber]|uniref:Transmembrane protein 207 n=1 Tax=Heterocephalus glaber TaxID=10181 RepID=G5BGV6_HETGA|nr:Transmembrane protein 207 [Heterocephalus glaber]